MEASIPGVYVHSIMVGGGPTADTLHGYFGNVDDQVKEQCVRLLAEPRLANGFFALGFSQGSQFIRALVQRCGGGERAGDGKLIVRRLVTMGGQHAGSPTSPVAPCTTATRPSAPSVARQSGDTTAVYSLHPRLRRAGAVFQGPGAIR